MLSMKLRPSRSPSNEVQSMSYGMATPQISSISVTRPGSTSSWSSLILRRSSRPICPTPCHDDGPTVASRATVHWPAMSGDTAVGPYHLSVHAARTPDNPAMIEGETGKAVSYAELEERSARLAGLLQGWGCRPGDHIAYLLENRAECAEVAWGPQRAGLHYTPLNVQLQVGELAWIVNDC